jgi:hypothetical protein
MGGILRLICNFYILTGFCEKCATGIAFLTHGYKVCVTYAVWEDGSYAKNRLFPAFFAEIASFMEGGMLFFKNVSYLCV